MNILPTSIKSIPLLFLRLLLPCLVLLTPAIAASQSSAVVIMYHRFGEAEYPSTNTTLSQLDAHIAELTSGAYTVLPVPEIIDKIKRGLPLPDRAVGITIDDAYRSVYTKAWPKLKAAGLPFTIFIATAHVDQKSPRHLTWEQIREMTRTGGVTIGHHTVSHLHMPTFAPDRISDEIENAFTRHEKELAARPALFAYPYGETSLAVISAIKQAGFTAAFGQHSGAIGGIGDMFNLPRFAMNEKYGDIARFRMTVNSLALPVTEITPAAHLIGELNPPTIGFTLKPGTRTTKGLACFTSHDGKAKLERLGPLRVEVRVVKPFPKGRTRLNCTLRGQSGRWHWLGRQFLKIN